jgi:hypothetical protein
LSFAEEILRNWYTATPTMSLDEVDSCEQLDEPAGMPHGVVGVVDVIPNEGR